jgi:mannose-1-phosphate guanylyltransferase/mannose-6-phosphate isomerase
MNVSTLNNRYGLILAGGSGTRLWPLSRTLRPKQFLSLNGEKTLLQQTVSRLTKNINPSQIYTVTHENLKFEVIEQLYEASPEAIQHVCAEPYSKNTLAAIAWASYQIYCQDKNALISVFASDHAINNEEAFYSAWKSAEEAAENDYFVLLGIKPYEPRTGYGYMKIGKKLDFDFASPVHELLQFIEKPNADLAEKFISKGYLWNSGMFIFKASVFFDLFKKFQRDIYEKISSITPENLSDIYQQLPNLSIDFGLLEPLSRTSRKIAIVPTDMGWSDLGTWDSIYSFQSKDMNNNVIKGKALSVNTKNSLIWADKGLIAAVGLENIMIIQTADATLVMNAHNLEDIKLLIADLKESEPSALELHKTVFRPWGNYTVLEEGSDFKIKKIIVKPGGQLSLQKHQYRSEHWVVISGVATITNDNEVYNLQQNQSTYIPQNHLHRLANNSSDPLEVIEVQCGAYVGEDDIVRLDDNYGRT